MSVKASNFVKEARQLAERVRAANLGLECEAADGHSYVVRRPGDARVVASFPAHPSHRDWRRRAEAALRKAGVAVERKVAKAKVMRPAEVEDPPLRKEGGMTAEVSEEQNNELMAKIHPLVGNGTRTEFLVDAVRLLDEAHRRGELLDVDQFGSTAGTGASKPVDIARSSLQQLVQKGGTTKEKAFRRWTTIADLVLAERERAAAPSAFEAAEQERAASENGSPSGPEGTPEAEADRAPRFVGMLERAEGAEEHARLAEELMKDAEAERDRQKDRGDKLESQNRVIRDRMKDAEAKVAEAEERARKAELRERGVRGQLGKQKNAAAAAGAAPARVAELEAALDEAERVAVAARDAEIQHAARVAEMELEASLQAAPESASFRDELGAYLMQLLGTTEYQESPPLWLLDRVDRLAGLR